MQDKTIKCRDCGEEFVFTAGEQEFYAQKGFSEPSRCPNCRAARKVSRGEGGSREREMYPAVCAQCGKPTEVPFQPRSDRPVYCSDCYAAQHPMGGGDRSRHSGSGGSRYNGGGSRGRGRRDDRW